MHLNDKFQITLLNNSNYQTWQFTIKQILKYRKVLQYVLEDIETPTEGEEKGTIENAKALAMSILSTSIDQDQIVLIINVDEPYQAWKILKEHHVEDTIQNKL